MTNTTNTILNMNLHAEFVDRIVNISTIYQFQIQIQITNILQYNLHLQIQIYGYKYKSQV